MSSSLETRSLAGDNIRSVSIAGVGYHGDSRAAQVVANWHDETHSGAFTMCQEQPCASGAFTMCQEQPCAAVRTVDARPSQ